jgi:hypothetical protein
LLKEKKEKIKTNMEKEKKMKRRIRNRRRSIERRKESTPEAEKRLFRKFGGSSRKYGVDLKRVRIGTTALS